MLDLLKAFAEFVAYLRGDAKSQIRGGPVVCLKLIPDLVSGVVAELQPEFAVKHLGNVCVAAAVCVLDGI